MALTIGEVYGQKPHRRPVFETPLVGWLRAHGVTKARFAKDIGVTVRTVNLWCNNQVLPDLVHAFGISEYTEGGVPPEMWMGTELAVFLRTHAKSDHDAARLKRREQNKRAYEKTKRKKHAKD